MLNLSQIKIIGIASGAIIGILAALFVFIWFQQEKIDTQNQEIGRQKETILSLERDNSALKEVAKINTAITISVASSSESLRQSSRKNAYKLRKDIANAGNQITENTVLPTAIIDTLCMQWQQASGLYSNASASPSTGAPNTPSAQCAGWNKMTYGDALEWNILLLEHAGLDILDKQGLKAWSQKVQARGE